MSAIKLEFGGVELLACRICLATDTKLLGIYDEGLDITFSDILGTSVSPQDGLPQHVCVECHTKLEQSAALRAQAKQTHEILSEALLQHCAFRLWHSLPVELRRAKSLPIFKKLLYEHLSSQS